MDMHIPAVPRAGSKTLPHVAATNDAEPLQALWDTYRKAEAEWHDACQASSDAEATAWQHYPKRDEDFYVVWEGTGPESERTRGALEDELVALSEQEIEKHGQDSQEAADARARIQRFRKWQLACRAVDAVHRKPALEKAQRKAERAMDLAEKRFVAAQPRTLQGILLKLEYLADIESMRDGGGNSDLLVRRVVLGLIDHLQAAMSRHGSNMPFGG